jgi:hypothetical protein
MTVMAICRSEARPVVIGYCTGRLMMGVPYTRGHSYRRRQSDDSTCAEEDDRVSKRWYRLSLVASVQHPASSHHDIDLKQQSTEVGGLYEFRFSGVWAERRSRSPRQGPERDGSDIEHDPRGEHWRRGPSKHQSRPDQLEERDRDEEQA